MSSKRTRGRLLLSPCLTLAPKSVRRRLSPLPFPRGPAPFPREQPKAVFNRPSGWTLLLGLLLEASLGLGRVRVGRKSSSGLLGLGVSWDELEEWSAFPSFLRFGEHEDKGEQNGPRSWQREQQRWPRSSAGGCPSAFCPRRPCGEGQPAQTEKSASIQSTWRESEREREQRQEYLLGLLVLFSRLVTLVSTSHFEGGA